MKTLRYTICSEIVNNKLLFLRNVKIYKKTGMVLNPLSIQAIHFSKISQIKVNGKTYNRTPLRIASKFMPL